MINLQVEYEKMINECAEHDAKEVNALNMLNTRAPVMFAGIDTIELNRQLYIDLGSEPWSVEQEKALPKWRGLSLKIIYFEKLGLIKDHYFLVIKQESEKSSEIFEAVLQNLVDHLLVMEKIDLLFSCVYKVLDRWRNFFIRGGYRKLTDEQQRGLFGELWFIHEWMKKYPGSPPLLIEQWEGPTIGRIDFANSKFGLEIKTSLEKLSKSIKISNERQLKLTPAIQTIYLYVVFIESSKTHGTTLQSLVNKIREEISRRSTRLLLIFNDFLIEIGFRDEEYGDVSFYVNETELYKAGEGFPRIETEHLPVGISHVSYNIDLTHCTEFKRELEEIFEVF